MLYVPFRNSETLHLPGHKSWNAAFETHKIKIAHNEKMVTSLVDNRGGDIDEVATKASETNQLIEDLNIDHIQKQSQIGILKYDIMGDMKNIKASQTIHASRSSLFSEISHPFLLPNK